MAKTSEKAVAASRGTKPDFVVRARQERNSRFFQTVGMAWRKTDRNGQEIISVKLNALPIDGDGSFLLVPPFTPEGEGE
jgi:uncharacterized protein (DUF736 family)